MPRKIRKISLRDRDLPQSYDPLKFYEYRIASRAVEAVGVESFLYKLIPYKVIGTFAFAIDPFSQFKVAPGKIAGISRNISSTTKSVLDFRSYEQGSRTVTCASIPNWQGSPGRWGPVRCNPPATPGSKGSLFTQPALPRKRSDTTSRTRKIDEKMGEFFLSRPTIISPPRSIAYLRAEDYQTGALNGLDVSNQSKTTTHSFGKLGPSAAWYSLFDYNTVLSAETSYLTNFMRDNAISMYRGVNPNFRNYTLFRNIIELRDLPRGITQLRDSMRHLSQLESVLFSRDVPQKTVAAVRSLTTSLKDVPKEYLSYHFGWKQTYNDIVDLLVKPARITKQVNFLLSRSGKPTSVRSRRTFESGATGYPGFSYDLFTGLENQISKITSASRTITLDMVANFTLDFPKADIPDFRRKKFNEKLGLYPSITDLYNLIPWTWLFDWFTGFGNYLELIEEVHKDRSTINWGFLTGKTDLRLTTNLITELVTSYTGRHGGVSYSYQSKSRKSHSSVLELHLHSRRNIASLTDVKTYADVKTLSPYQQSILGALLASRTKRV